MKYQNIQKQEIKQAFKTSTDAKEQKRLLCLKLRVEQGFNAKQIAEIIECSEIQVRTIISKYKKNGLSSILRGHQGGNHRNLSFFEEEVLLAPFLNKAEKGQILIVPEIHKAYEAAFGRSVPPSTIYRMLERHNWRKVMSRPRHPKADPDAQEAYKKNSGEDRGIGKI
jgi:transposase